MKNIIVIVLISISSICYSNDFNGHWKGKILLEGSGWPMRLHINQNIDSVVVLLDIPNLVYAREPVQAIINGQILDITLPFGLGHIKFNRKGDELIPLDVNRSTTFIKTEEPPYIIEAISWKSGNELLKGSLYIPKSEGRHPLLIRLHGSRLGNRSRWEYRSWGDYFARMGIATVVFDRRGEGESTSNSEDFGFINLANDAIKLIDKMKKRNDVDSDKIILNGGSQAAYISLIANSKSNDVDFMILSGAPSVSLIEQERQSLIFRMRKKNEPNELIVEALGYQELYFHYIMTGKNWIALKKAAFEVQNKPWAKYTDQPQNETDLKWWRDNFNAFQPQELIPLIKIPMLIIFGENDVITPPSIMIPQFSNFLKDSNNDAIKIVVCPDVGHSLEEKWRNDRWGNMIFPQRSSLMFTEIEKWLNKFGLSE